MAKIAFTKLGLNKNIEVKILKWNEQDIEIKQYLPIQDKFDLIAAVLNQCQDANNFINEAKLQLYFDLEVVFRYTNINFTDKQKEDTAKLYDLLSGSGLLEKIYSNIPEGEWSILYQQIKKNANHIYTYRNSIYGILDAMSTDYQGLDLDITKLAEKMSDPNNLELVKGVLTKLG